jgi:hypothetical protein
MTGDSLEDLNRFSPFRLRPIGVLGLDAAVAGEAGAADNPGGGEVTEPEGAAAADVAAVAAVLARLGVAASVPANSDEAAGGVNGTGADVMDTMAGSFHAAC